MAGWKTKIFKITIFLKPSLDCKGVNFCYKMTQRQIGRICFQKLVTLVEQIKFGHLTFLTLISCEHF